MHKFVLTFIVTGIVASLSWQPKSEPSNGYLLVSDEVRIEQLSVVLREKFAEVSIKDIYPSLGFYSLSNENTRAATPARGDLERWEQQGLIDTWYEDRFLTVRTTPNDPLWPEQWDFDRIDMPDAWDIATGGLTITGDTIVVAILDSGFDVDHPDLKANYWQNIGEIPNDSIDNDMNGYIDDYIGLNIQTGNDAHPKESHGTSVSGIIGAVGNNDEGVSGVNWAVKLLPVSGIKKESDLIEAYNYVMQFRELYNDSDGRDGAFVVVTNSSLGIDGAWAEDHPMWCAAYDDMGQTGILSVAATTNRSSLVDEEGDMPSTCTSNFLITVTNTDIDDQLYQVAGYGPVHVDLGAPGENSLTTTINNSYNTFGGTSAASPHVAGTIALLYSAPCAAFMNQVKSQPVGAALQLKSLLFESVDPLGTLEGKTVTGGRLNTGVVMHGLCNAFEGPPVDFGINSVYPNPGRGRLTIEISTSHFDMHTLRIFDSAGRLVSETELFPSSQIYRHQFYIPSDMPGVYMALLEHEDDHTSYSFVVQ